MSARRILRRPLRKGESFERDGAASAAPLSFCGAHRSSVAPIEATWRLARARSVVAYCLRIMRSAKHFPHWVLLSLLYVVPAVSQQVAFTFDDLPAHGDLPPGQTRLEVAESILRTLHDQHMPPVYGFVNAVKLEKSPDDIAVLKAWRAAGEPLGNHAYSHPSLNEVTVEQFESDIAKNEPILSKLMVGEDWHWFRYPFLWEGDTLEKRHAVRAYLQQNGYRVAQVSLDFEDYLWNEPYARCFDKRDD